MIACNIDALFQSFRNSIKVTQNHTSLPLKLGHKPAKLVIAQAKFNGYVFNNIS